MTEPDEKVVSESLARKLLAAEVNHSVAQGIIAAQERRIQELEALIDEEHASRA